MNQNVNRFKRIQNEKLMRILERVELDKPIIMHDKLDVIWDFENDNINHYEVKKDLEDLKVRRMAQNNKQFRAY